jgi:hypothetical protein
MDGPWVEVRAGGRAVRRPFGPGPLALDPSGAIAPAKSAGERLVLFPEPLRAVFEGRGEPPRLAGRELVQARFERGDVLHWRGLEIRVGPREAALEELPAQALPGAAGPAGPAGAAGGAAWKCVKAGLLVEIGLAEGAAARRAQESVIERAFDPAAAAAEILRASGVSDGDPRLLERSARLMRDLIMAPLQRGVPGARRRLRRAATSGFAWLLSQFIVVGTVMLLLAVALLASRARWKVSVDGALDRVLDVLGIG